MNVPHPNGLDFMWFLTVRIVMSLSFLRTGCYFSVLYSQLTWLMEKCPLKGQLTQITKRLFHLNLNWDLSWIILPPSEYNVGELNCVCGAHCSETLNNSQKCVFPGTVVLWSSIIRRPTLFTGTAFYLRKSLCSTCSQ